MELRPEAGAETGELFASLAKALQLDARSAALRLATEGKLGFHAGFYSHTEVVAHLLHLVVQLALFNRPPGEDAQIQTINEVETQTVMEAQVQTGEAETDTSLEAGSAQYALDSRQAWSAPHAEAGEWLQLDLLTVTTVLGTVVQGAPDRDEWVTEYAVSCSVDGWTWNHVPCSFVGSWDRTGKISAVFPAPVQARYVRLVVQHWQGHPSMRVGVLRLPDPDILAGPPCRRRLRSAVKHARAGVRIGGGYRVVRSASCAHLPTVTEALRPAPRARDDFYTGYVHGAPARATSPERLSVGIYASPPGSHERVVARDLARSPSPDRSASSSSSLVVLNPEEAARSYSSELQPARSELDSPQAWSALRRQAGEWVQLDLGAVTTVVGAVLQGAPDCDQWVTQYTVSCSDGTTWTDLPSSFVGNCDRDTKVPALFPSTVQARYVKVVVQQWHGHPCFRVGLLVPWDRFFRVLRPLTSREASGDWSAAARGAAAAALLAQRARRPEPHARGPVRGLMLDATVTAGRASAEGTLWQGSAETLPRSSGASRGPAAVSSGQ